MKAMLFAAGLGTRLKPFTEKHPKALAPVNGKSILELNIRYLRSFGIEDVVVNVHHFADQIIETLEENKGFGSHYYISDERDSVLETGGGLLKAAAYFQEESFVVMNVDMLTNLDLNRMIEQHLAKKPLATLAVMQRISSRELLFDEALHLCAWRNNISGEQKIARPQSAINAFAFSGIQIIHTDFFKHNLLRGKFSIIDAYLGLAKEHPILGFDHTGDLILDVGKPESLLQAAQLFP